MRYAMVEELRLHYPVTYLCHQLSVSESGYYSWRCRPPSQRKNDDTKLKIVISAAHKRTRETCGPERLQQDIAELEGITI